MLKPYLKIAAVTVLAASAGTVANAQSVKGTVTLKNIPEGIAVNPFNNRIYVAVPTFGAKPYDYLQEIDGNTDTVTKTIQIPPFAYAVAIDPLTSTIFVGGTSEDKNGVIQSEVVTVSDHTKQVLGTIHVSSTPGDGIQGLAVNSLTGDLYVSNGSDNEIDVIHSGKVTTRIPVAGEPFGVAVNPFSNQVYAALINGNVAVINAATNTVTATTAVGTSDAGIAVNFFTGNVYTTNQVFTESSTVGVLGAAGNVITNIPVGNTPIGIDVDPVTNLAFVANTQDGTVSVINQATNTVSATLPVSGLFVAANFVTGKVYVGSDNSSPIVTVISEK
ncbi:hypothetical protein ACPOL_0162 [Acidisarcina polymorpha]|uniref:Collagen triple helix repeat domain protein n=1 Tax=Acidisarcina polymorpha TaxID=2211140 RepID=A0A2Z5FSU7_9BACT|nr:YncE family protein [Acidisarcina polymorpha]AXC09547.1 hypothetical protein ACPOL_0162 [Acidisarcina polymorpha]